MPAPVQAGWRATVRPDSTQSNIKTTQFNSYTSEKPRVSALGALSPILCSRQVLCSENTFSTGILQSPREKNDASAQRKRSMWHRMVLTRKKVITLIWREASNHASFTLPDTGPQKQAALARHCGETSDKDCWRGAGTKGLSLCEQRRWAFEWKLYTSSWETLPHRKPQNKPLPLGSLPHSSMELGASQLGHKAKSISTFPSQENHFPVVPFISV